MSRKNNPKKESTVYETDDTEEQPDKKKDALQRKPITKGQWQKFKPEYRTVYPALNLMCGSYFVHCKACKA